METNNCNRVNREGNCDGKLWVECLYCGAIDNNPCTNVKKPDIINPTQKYREEGLRKLLLGHSASPYELEAIVIDLIHRVEAIEKTINPQG